jgi:hypothetical protein
MERIFWSLGLVAAFVVGLGAGRVVWHGESAVQEAGDQETISRLEQQLVALRAKNGSAAAPSVTASATTSAASKTPDRFIGTGFGADRMPADGSAPSALPRASGAAADRAAVATGPRGSSIPSLHMALERFQRYREVMRTEGRDRWREMREIADELRSMGGVAGEALMHVLASNADSDDRRTAAQLLGQLRLPQALTALKDVIDKDEDILLRRAAASALRQLQTPESLQVMEHLITNPNEDRFVRLSAAAGLVDAGLPLGVVGLHQIFTESTADGRGRELAFRALARLNDDRSLPFMRQVLGSPIEPAYRLRAIQYLAAQGDRQSLPTLLTVSRSPSEQPSIRDAAARAYTAISSR